MVFITKQKPLFKDEIIDVEIIPVVDVKIYEGKPQIKTKGHLVEIYFVGKEKEFYFNSKQEMHKFIDESIKLITGKTKAERFADKIKDGINLTNNTLGVDIIDFTKNVVQNGTSKIVNETVDRISDNVNSKLAIIRQKIIDIFSAQYSSAMEKIAPVKAILDALPISANFGSIITALIAVIDVITAPYTPVIEFITQVIPKVLELSSKLQTIASYRPQINIPNVEIPPLNINVEPISAKDITG